MNTDKKIAVIITSVIACSEKPLSYSDTRSIFSKEERLEQTLLTIASVRKNIPGATIILLELGRSYKENEKLKCLVDQYIDLSNDKPVRFFVDGRYKGLGEIFGILRGLSEIGVYDFYIKISGRYFLKEEIPEKFYRKGFGFLRIGKNYSTRFYIVSRDFFSRYRTILRISMFLSMFRSIEKILYIVLPKKWVHDLEYVGIEGQIGVDKNIVRE